MEEKAGTGTSAAGPRNSLARKYSRFTAILLTWVAFVFAAYDLRSGRLDPVKIGLLAVIVPAAAVALSRFTHHLMALPLVRLQEGIHAVGQGRLEPIRVSRTGDEIEYLGDRLNEMIAALRASREEVREHQEQLEEKIRQRTEALQEATHRALAASRAKSEFLANISHELRTPMNGILGMIDIVLDDEISAAQREHLETSKSCANSLLALLNDLLDLSKIEAGKMMLEHIAYDVRAVAEDCARSLQPRARQKGIVLRCVIGSETPARVLGDPLRMRQMITNLLSNAVKFTEQGHVELMLGLRPPAGAALGEGGGGLPQLTVAVRDTGVGIPSDKLAAIFEEFTQADGSVSRKYGGTGLGLAITRKLAAMHGGAVTVESRVGVGSTFRVELPVEVAEQAAAEGSGGRAAAILVVEDNAVNEKVVTALLAKQGFQVVAAHNGREALQELERTSVDLILMDIQMPEMDGITAARLIRENPRWRTLPIVAMTAHALTGDRERCLAAGMNGYLSKPVAPAQVLDTVRRFLRAAAEGGAAAGAGVRSGSMIGAMPAAAAPGAERPSPIDRPLATRLMDGDANLLNGMVMLFLQLAPERLQKLEAAVIRQDAPALQSNAMKLETAAQRIAALEVARAARELAAAAHSQDFALLRELLGRLAGEIRRLESAMRSPEPAGAAVPVMAYAG